MSHEYAYGGMSGYAKGGSVHHGGPEFEGEGEEDPMAEVEERAETAQMLGEPGIAGRQYGRELEQTEPVEGYETESHTRTEASHDGAFVDAIRRKARQHMAAGGEAGEYMHAGIEKPMEQPAMMDEEMEAKKRQKYGWHGKGR
jgi:hypothetical protein